MRRTPAMILQAWKAGPETVALRRQLEAMPDGGTFAITIPLAPYRCPPGPYERACQVASYFKAAKPKSKVLILDANPDVTSKPALFKKVWAEQYAGMVEYRAQHNATAVDARTNTVKFEMQDDVKADVLNVLPPMRAGAIAVQTGLANSNARWCNVNYQTSPAPRPKTSTCSATRSRSRPAMPKSGHMANSHAKVAAAAIVAELSGWEINPQPMLTNTCYSFTDAKNVIHVASVHEYVAAEKTFKTVAGSGGVSSAPNEQEGNYAWNWAKTRSGRMRLADRRAAAARRGAQPWPMIAAVATISSNSAIDTLPLTAYGSSLAHSEYFSSSAGFRRCMLTWPIDQPEKRRSSISS